MRLRKAVVVPLAVLALAGGGFVAANQVSAHGNSRHVLSLGGSVRITDDENWPESDEHCTRGLSGFDTAQLPSDSTAFVADRDNGCGGEVRVEVSATGTLDADGRYCLKGRIELYEGTSEGNHDLDGATSFSGCVNSDGTLRMTRRVNNTAEGGDFADVDMVWTDAH